MEYRCKNCKYKWLTRKKKAVKPKACPNCKSYKWGK